MLVVGASSIYIWSSCSFHVTRASLLAAAAAGALVLSSGAAMAQSCSSFKTCKEAVASLRDGNSKLDRDKDGIPCEKLCGSNGEYM